MNPDIADDLESVPNLYTFSKSMTHRVVLPIDEEESDQIEMMRQKQALELPEELTYIKKEGYVSVISGDHAGRYGIVMGTKSGKVEVCLRSEYKGKLFACRLFSEISFAPISAAPRLILCSQS